MILLLSFKQKEAHRKLREKDAEGQSQVNDLVEKLKDYEDNKTKDDQALKELEAEQESNEEYLKQCKREKESLQNLIKKKEYELTTQISSEGSALGDGVKGQDIEHQKIVYKLCKKLCKFAKTHDCLEAFSDALADSFSIQGSAYKSAKDAKGFEDTEKLFDLLWKLGTDFRKAKLEGKPDKDAAKIFGKKYASNESERTKKDPKPRKERTFDYKEKKVTVRQHLKIGIQESPNRTLRIYFIWDDEERKVVVFHCGKHLYTPK